MAGEWIKMRTNLWNDPRVSQLCDLTDKPKSTVIGGLYWLWSSADEHTESGHMPGLSIKGIDRESGIKSFGAALAKIGWIEDTPDGITLIRFDEHNGASAKQRSLTAKRVASHKSNAKVTQEDENGNAASVTSALPRIRIREEVNSKAEEAVGASDADRPAPLARAIEINTLLRKAGITGCTAMNPHIAVTWAQNAAVTDTVLLAAVDLAKERKTDGPVPVGYLPRIVENVLKQPPAAAPAKRDWL